MMEIYYGLLFSLGRYMGPKAGLQTTNEGKSVPLQPPGEATGKSELITLSGLSLRRGYLSSL